MVERDRLRAQLVILTPPAMPDLKQAAELLQDVGRIEDKATLQERQQIVHTLLEIVYLDVELGPVVPIELKAKFAPLFEMMAAGEAESDNSAGSIIIPTGADFLSGKDSI